MSLGISGDSEAVGFKDPPPGFQVTWDRDYIGPVLWVRNGKGQASPVVGGTRWDLGFLQEDPDGWSCALDDELQLLRKTSNEKRPGSGFLTTDRTLAAALQRASRLQGLTVIADFVYPRGNAICWLGQTPKQTMQHLVLRNKLVCKQVGDVWLLRDPIGVVHPRPHLLPWAEIRSLRDAAASNQGYLDLKSLTRIAAATEPQLDALSEEFPTLVPSALQPWLPILRFHQELAPNARARLQSQEGIPLRQAGLVARNVLAEGPELAELRGLPLLQQYYQNAVVSFREETVPVASAARTTQTTRALVWTIRIPDLPERRRVVWLEPRKPLQPNGATEEALKPMPEPSE